MSRIDVTSDGKKFKVMVNFETRFILSTARTANNEAIKLHETKHPNHDLNLIKED